MAKSDLLYFVVDGIPRQITEEAAIKEQMALSASRGNCYADNELGRNAALCEWTNRMGATSASAQHQPGAKLDSGKVRPALVIEGFANALLAVSEVGTFGANKYTDNGWGEVPNGVNRYTNAMHRHLLQEATGEICDEESQLPHAAHAAWNALARLELMLRIAGK